MNLPIRTIAVTLLAMSLLLLIVRFERPSALEQVKSSGKLIVAMRNSPTTYYEGPQGPTGLEYDLAMRFADRLGVRLQIVMPPNLNKLLSLVNDGDVDLAAAGLTVTEPRKAVVRFGPPYQEITQQLIYRTGSPAPVPRGISDLPGHQIEVVASSSHVERLKELKREEPRLEWTENAELGSEELLNLVWEQVIDYTVADSNEMALNQRFYPELRVAFDLTEPQQLAWAFPMNKDNSLYDAAVEFFQQMEESGDLERLLAIYYGYVERFDYVGTRTYMAHIQQRLPSYRKLFEEAGAQYQVDWRLLAAMGYQESHWNPRARSPTGVRGIMMLTLHTADHVGIDNRLDPEQSIEGGARHFSGLVSRIPEQIQEPDRIWMAVAAYNIGLGHLEDARVITQRRGGNPNKWKDVKENLPLLSRKKWYKRTKHGYARGWEPVRYVENIRSYYDILVWMQDKDKPKQEEPKAGSIDSPVL